MEVTGELRLIVTVSVDGEGERFTTGAANVGDVVVGDIMRSNITLGSLCCCIDQVSFQHLQTLQTFAQVLVPQP